MCILFLQKTVLLLLQKPAISVKEIILFSTEEYSYLKDDLLRISGWEEGVILKKQFPDGEIYHKIQSNCKGKIAILIGGTIDDKNTMELYDLAQGISHSGTKSLHIVIPYFGYSTMERAVEPGEIVKAKNRALLFSSIPMCEDANNIYLMDLHSEGIPYYFDREVRTSHIYCKDIVMDFIAKNNLQDGVLAATDAGRAKWVESLAFDLNMKSAFVYKQRLSGSETVITGVNADVKGKKVIMYDDMIRTGGSLIKAADAYHAAGASEIIAITTHGLFTNQALEKIAQHGKISKVVATNTHPNVLRVQSELLVVRSVAEILYQLLK